MHVWLVKLEESFPFDEGFRPYRMHMLATTLTSRGHRVTRWASDFDHFSLKARFGKDSSIEINPLYRVNLLHSPIKYSKRVSLSRVVSNWLVSKKFRTEAPNSDRPDIIVCSMPTPGMAATAVAIGLELKIPVVLDARDLWPDIIKEELSQRFLH
jgi:hypothetical protein